MKVAAWASFIPGMILLLGMGMLSIAGLGRAAEGSEGVLPDEYYPKMLNHLTKGVQDALKGSPKAEQVGKARTAAIMIAACAQQNLNGADGQQRATIRDAALKIAQAIDAKDYDAARKLTGELAMLKADAKAKKEKIKLIDDHVNMHGLMNQFNHPPEGGWGIHREFYGYQLGMKGTIPATDLNEKLTLKAYQVAVTADLMSVKVPKMNNKEWATYTADMRQGALNLVNAVKAKDGKAGLEAVARVTNSCTNCHKVFGGGPR